MARFKRPNSPLKKPKSKGVTQNAGKSKIVGMTAKILKTPKLQSLLKDQHTGRTSVDRPKPSEPHTVKFKQDIPSPAELFMMHGRPLRKTTIGKSNIISQVIEEESSSSDEEGTEAESEEGEEWAGEFTLVDGLRDFDDEENDEAKRNEAIVLGLQGPFAALSTDMKKDLVDVLAPTTEQLRGVHEKIRGYDDRATLAIVAFSKEAETIQIDAAENAAALKGAMSDSQVKLKQLFNSLKAAYASREDARAGLLDMIEGIQVQLDQDLSDLGDEFERASGAAQGKVDALAKSRTTKADMDKFAQMMMGAMT